MNAVEATADAVRDCLLAELRCGVLRAKLLALEYETAGVALKHRLVTAEQAMELLDVREALDWLDLGGEPDRTREYYPDE